MKPCQYCNKKHNNNKYCSVECVNLSRRKENRTLVTHGLKHSLNEIVPTVRGVLKQAKTVADYHKMCIASEQRLKEENPYK